MFLCSHIDLCAAPPSLISPSPTDAQFVTSSLPNVFAPAARSCTAQKLSSVDPIHAGSPNPMTFHRRSFVRLPLCKFLPHLFNTQPSSDLRVFLQKPSVCNYVFPSCYDSFEFISVLSLTFEIILKSKFLNLKFQTKSRKYFKNLKKKLQNFFNKLRT